MTVALDKDRYLSTGQLRALDAAGMTIGLHTWNHHRVDRYAGDDGKVQIQEPTQQLEQLLGHPIRYFAYPFGVWSPDAFGHVRRNGYPGRVPAHRGAVEQGRAAAHPAPTDRQRLLEHRTVRRAPGRVVLTGNARPHGDRRMTIALRWPATVHGAVPTP
jgi:peptidoglycan/xylan/chitin deacetylase (PgdA/CDA1 family)